MLDDKAFERLFKDLELTLNTLTDTWRIYMTWFTFFFTANLLVMSWVFTKPDELGESESIWILSLIWIIFNLVGAIHAFINAHYNSVALTRIDRIRGQLYEGSQKVLEQTAALPRAQIKLGAIGMGGALIMNAFIWSYIWCKFG